MDTDGDKAFITKHKTIVNAIKRNGSCPIVFDAGLEAKKEKWNKKNLLAYFTLTSSRDQVGYITSLATRCRELENNNLGSFQSSITKLRLIQGWEIDAVKYGKRQEIPDKLKNINYMPSWYVDLKKDSSLTIEQAIKERKLKNKKLVIYISNSPLGRNYRYMKQYIRNFYDNKKDTHIKNFTADLFSTIDTSNIAKYIPAVKKLEKDYRKDISALFNTIDDINEDVDMSLFDSIINKYRDILLTLVPSEEIASAIAYHICYNRSSKAVSGSKSFVWNVCFDGLIKLLSKFNKSCQLVSIPCFICNDENNTAKVINNRLYVNNNYRCVCKYEDGEYNVIKLNNNYYIQFPYVCNVIKDNLVNEKYKFRVAGFKFNGIDTFKFINIIKNNEITLFQNDKGYIKVLANNKVIANVLKDDVINANSIIDCKCKVIDFEKPLFIPKTITKKTVMYDDRRAVRQSLNIIVTVVERNVAINDNVINNNTVDNDVIANNEFDTAFETVASSIDDISNNDDYYENCYDNDYNDNLDSLEQNYNEEDAEDVSIKFI